ncbi:MAG: oligoendopeptidase F [Clostridia bacterium]|nr:oligoendopeptidase F [Clostridia bacterium]
MKKVANRSEISAEYKWDLSAIYKDDCAWESDFEALKTKLPEIKKFDGKLDSADNILACLKLSDELSMTAGELYVYARQKQDEDADNAVYQAMCDRAEVLGVDLSEAMSFISPQLAKLNNDFLLSLAEKSEFLSYDYMLKEVVRGKEHTLSDAEEKIIAQAGLFSGGFHDAFNMFDSVDIKFKKVKDSDGDSVAMSHGNYAVLLQSKDRSVRRAAFNSMFGAYKDMINTITQLYAGNIKKDLFYAKVRKYPNCLSRAVDGENVPASVYETLVKCVDANVGQLHNYMAFRARKLGLKKLNMYDLHMPIFERKNKDVDYEDAKEIVLSALSVMGKEYIGVVKRAFDEKWIDVYENKGKRSGAYSWGTYNSHPYMLLNYNGTMHDVFTLAHEMGHSMHSYYSDKAQPFAKAQYEIFVAEVASTVNEVLLLKYLLRNTEDKEEKKYLLSYYLDMFRTTLFRQTMFAEFEVKAHALAESGKPVTKEELCGIYYELNKKYYGDSVISDDLIRYEWARIPHFYRSFYVYKYATGIISAVSIASSILEKGDKAVAQYKKFLRAGGSMPPVEILKLAGVDLTTDAPYNTAMREFCDTLCNLTDLDR